MTISTEVRKAGPFVGNDSASAFPFAFKVFKAADLIVVLRPDNIGEETTLVLDSDYHVTLNGNQDTTPGGVVTLVAGALASGFTLVVSSELPYLQPTDLTNQGGFYPKVITNALDRLTIFCQQLLEITGRTLKLPITAPTNISAEIPLPNPSELIAWNETGTGLTTVSPQSLVTSIAYGSATADLFAGDGVTTTFPLSANPASVNNLDVSVGGFSQRPVQEGIGDYSWNGGASITFASPPPAPTVPGDKNVLVRYMQAIPVSDSEALHAQTREALRRSYAEAGYNLVDGSFETGGTLASTSDVLLLESAGTAYAWTGAYPSGGYVVAPGIDPTVVPGFVLRKNVALRAELSEVDGANLVGGATYAQIRAYTGTAKKINCLGRTNTFDGAHGDFTLDQADTASADNDGTILIDASGRRWKRQLSSGEVNVLWFGADRNGIADSLPAFNKAVASVSSLGGDVYAPMGFYKLLGKFTLTAGVSFRGDGCFKGTDANREGVTVLFCEHTEGAMLSLKGANGCTVRDISLQGSSVLKPKTGLALGRSSSASAGHHHIENVTVIGYFTVAGIYIAASEENIFTNVWSWNFGGNANYGLVISTQDVFGVDGMVTSTCLVNNFYGLKIYNTSPSMSAAGILLECAQVMGSINFFGCYVIQYAGSYVRISQGAIDGLPALGPFNFHGLAGEIYSGGAPKIGIDMVSSVPLKWNCITISNPRLQLPANSGGDVFDIRQDSNTTLVHPSISMPPPEAFPYAISQVRREKIIGGSVSVGRVAEWTPLALNAGWVSSNSAPYAQPAYRVGNDGIVELIGEIQSASGGAIASLPYAAGRGDVIFPTVGSGAVARVKLEKSTGVLSLLSGAASTGLDLSGIRFSIY